MVTAPAARAKGAAAMDEAQIATQGLLGFLSGPGMTEVKLAVVVCSSAVVGLKIWVGRPRESGHLENVAANLQVTAAALAEVSSSQAAMAGRLDEMISDVRALTGTVKDLVAEVRVAPHLPANDVRGGA